VAGHPGRSRIVAYTKYSIKRLTVAYDSGLRIADSNNTSTAARITKNSVACTVLAKYATSCGRMGDTLDAIERIAIARNSSSVPDVTNYPPAGRRIAKHAIAANSLAKHAGTADGAEAVSHHTAATGAGGLCTCGVFSKNARYVWVR
jgi:hypothetical protein